jgi:acylphosphatase
VVCKRCFVSGRVQGVYYRASTADRARALGVTGHALNLPDGRVEVLACGPHEAVEELLAWLHVGPSGAAVAEVHAHEETLEAVPAYFTTG